MKIEKQKYKSSQSVLIFNPLQVLIAIVRSVNSAAELTGGNIQSISFASTGKHVTSGGYYFRYIYPNIQINIGQLNVLKLKEYDQMCGEERTYYKKKYIYFLKQQYQRKMMKKWNEQNGKSE
ncbi:MAG: hypothetical protein LBP72_09695 [Dysgonamonadaceae bacterium]|jgi:hypothetical protein|nr:hypothetical protein [Dysgonamonadaceae bacterium]